jgi:hypothetical protein
MSLHVHLSIESYSPQNSLATPVAQEVNRSVGFCVWCALPTAADLWFRVMRALQHGLADPPSVMSSGDEVARSRPGRTIKDEQQQISPPKVASGSKSTSSKWLPPSRNELSAIANTGSLTRYIGPHRPHLNKRWSSKREARNVYRVAD